MKLYNYIASNYITSNVVVYDYIASNYITTMKLYDYLPNYITTMLVNTTTCQGSRILLQWSYTTTSRRHVIVVMIV